MEQRSVIGAGKGAIAFTSPFCLAISEKECLVIFMSCVS